MVQLTGRKKLQLSVGTLCLWFQRFRKGCGPHYTIVMLPQYSPELNPMENLWHYLRSHYWSNRTYADHDDLRLAAIDAWRDAAPNPFLVQSACRASYADRI
jgi:hypothetical protein